MINSSLYGEPIMNYKSCVYISKKLPNTQDEDMNDVENYDKPKKYFFNIQPISADSEVREFGQLANSMRVAVVSKRVFLGKFKEFDKAYIETKPSDSEIENGQDADYRIYGIRPQNAVLRIYFLKLVRNSMIGDENRE